LVLNGLVVEYHLLLGGTGEQQPSNTCTSCHLEDLRRVRLCKGNFLVWEFTLEDLHGDFKILELFDISERHSYRVDEHWNQTKLRSEDHGSDVVCEPHNHIGIEPNPDNADEQSERVVVVVSLAQGTWDCKILSMSQRHQG
jgi:hypothetical protein